MKKVIYLAFLMFSYGIYSQVGINTETPNPKAVLELKQNDNDVAKGFMLTRLTDTEMDAMNLTSTDEGMVIYNKTQKKFFGWDGTSWQNLGYEEANTVPYFTSSPYVTISSNNGTNIGSVLTANYTITDADGADTANLGSNIIWKRADDASGTNEIQIAGETSFTYTTVSTDTGKYLQSCVTPTASTGASPGIQQCSDWFGAMAVTLPTVQFTSATSSIAENAGTQTLTLSLSSASTSTVTVQVAIKTGDATDINNYTTQTISFSPSETSKDLTIDITDDTVYESDEDIVFELLNPNNCTEGIVNEHTLTITNDDPIDCTIHGAVRVNEFNYDDDGGDDEWVEIRIANPQPHSSCLNQFKIYGYNQNGTVIGTYNFGSPSSTGTSTGYSYYVIHPGSNAFQNGSDDGFGFTAPDGTKELLSWEGTYTVPTSDANFGGQTSTDVGVAQSNIDNSISRDDTGNWSLDATPTEGAENN